MTNNNYWIIHFKGDWRQTNPLSLKLGAPDAFRPASILPMPMSVVRSGLRDAQVWRVHHWGLKEEPRKVRWRRHKDGAYTLAAEGGVGVPINLVKQASLEHKKVEFCLVWRSVFGIQHGQIWRAGETVDVPEEIQDQMLQQEFNLEPLAQPF